MSDSQKKDEGKGGGLLEDPSRSGADARLISRALSKRWAIPDSMRDSLVEKLGKMASSDHPRAISAARTLVRMEEQNQEDEHTDRHYQRIDEDKPTDLVRLSGVEIIVPGLPNVEKA